MKYLIAIAIALTIIGAIVLYTYYLGRTIKATMRDRFKAAQAAGEIPKDIDPDHADFTDFGTEVSESEMWQIGMLDAMNSLRFVLIPGLILVSLGVARMLECPTTGGPKSSAVKSD